MYIPYILNTNEKQTFNIKSTPNETPTTQHKPKVEPKPYTFVMNDHIKKIQILIACCSHQSHKRPNYLWYLVKLHV